MLTKIFPRISSTLPDIPLPHSHFGYIINHIHHAGAYAFPPNQFVMHEYSQARCMTKHATCQRQSHSNDEGSQTEDIFHHFFYCTEKCE
jgi:hypothetical protein